SLERLETRQLIDVRTGDECLLASASQDRSPHLGILLDVRSALLEVGDRLPIQGVVLIRAVDRHQRYRFLHLGWEVLVFHGSPRISLVGANFRQDERSESRPKRAAEWTARIIFGKALEELILWLGHGFVGPFKDFGAAAIGRRCAAA